MFFFFIFNILNFLFFLFFTLNSQFIFLYSYWHSAKKKSKLFYFIYFSFRFKYKGEISDHEHLVFCYKGKNSKEKKVNTFTQHTIIHYIFIGRQNKIAKICSTK